MSDEAPVRPGLIQVKLSPEVKKFIQARAREEERSQGWMAAKMLEEAVKREQGAAQ